MSNPWRLSIFDALKNLIRFLLWMAVTVNAAMLSVFSIIFMYHFLHHLWDLLARTWFATDW